MEKRRNFFNNAVFGLPNSPPLGAPVNKGGVKDFLDRRVDK